VSVSGLGFQPKVVIFLGSKQTATGQGAHVQLGIGAATSSTARGCVSARARDAQTTSSATSRANDTSCWSVMLDGSSSVAGVLDFVSMDSDGFTVVPDTAFGTSYSVTYLALGGTSLTNAIVLPSTLASGTGNQSFTGAGFQPDCVLALATKATSFSVGSGSGMLSVGVATSSTSRACVSALTDDADASGSNSRSILRSDRFLVFPDVGADTISQTIDFVSMDTDGLTISTSANTTLNKIIFICLKGASAKVGTVAANTSTGTAATSSVGFKPSALLLASTNATTSTQTAVNTGFEFMLGVASAPTERGSIWGIDEDALTTTDNQSRYDTGGLWIDYAGSTGFAIEGEAELSSFDSDGFTLDTVDAFPAANLAIYLALGPSAASSTLTQEGYQWYADDGSESGSSTLAAQDTGITRAAGGVGRIRMLVDATGDPATKQYKLQYKLSTDGTWSDIA